MSLRWLMIVVLAFVPATVFPADPAPNRNGTADDPEEILGIDPQAFDRLQAILDDGLESATVRTRDTYDGSKDFTHVEFCHVGDDRYLWRVTFADPPQLSDTVLHLYVDADHDPATGRRGSPGSSFAGTDFMLSVVADRGSSSAFSGDGRQTTGPAVRHLVRGNAVYLSADLPLARDASGVRYGLYVLCHTTTTAEHPSPRMSDSSAKVTVANIPLSDQPKRMRPADYLDNHNVSATFGEDLLHASLAASGVIVVPHDQLQTEGFEVDSQTTHRWPHLRLVANRGSAWTTAPRAGPYHVGFLMYDDSNDERLGFYVDGQFLGVAVAKQNNNRTWLYWLNEPQQFQGGERVEIRTLGGRGKFGIANAVFLPSAPEVRTVRTAVENVTVSNPVGRPGVAVISWTTTWPSPTRLTYALDLQLDETPPRGPVSPRPDSLREKTQLREETSDAPCLVHRVVLEDLDPTASYRGRAIAIGPDGSEAAGEEFTFRASPTAPAATGAKMGQAPSVHDPEPVPFSQAPGNHAPEPASEAPKMGQAPGIHDLEPVPFSQAPGIHDLEPVPFSELPLAIPLAVRNPHDFAVDRWPITTGIPFARGALTDPSHARLVCGADEVPAQIQLTARWPDGSVKWLLIIFLARVPAAGQAVYHLECGPAVRQAAVAAGLAVQASADGVRISTGALTFRVDRQGNLTDASAEDGYRFADHALAATEAEDPHGTVFAPGDGTVEVEESGPIRAVIKSVFALRGCEKPGLAPSRNPKSTGNLVGSEVPVPVSSQPPHNAGGAHLARIEQRIEAYSGLSWIRVHHTLVVDGPQQFTELKRLTYRVPIVGTAWTAPLADGQSVQVDSATRGLYQLFDDTISRGIAPKMGQAPGIHDPEPVPFSARSGRVVGNLLSADPRGGAVAVRDFWQNYPKAFRITDDSVQIDLCPAFPEGTYDKFPFEKEGHHLYFYLLGGRYRLKQGMSKTHELLLSLAPSTDQAAIGALFQRPLLATAPAEIYCGSGAFYDVAPRNPQRFPGYEQAIDRNVRAYAESRERQRDYGMMNYGDWYGERGTNWGNVEYDTQHALLLEYVRSGNPEAFFLAHAAELHNRDVDTVQAAADPRQVGAVNIHVIGHVGDYFDQPVPGALGFVRGGFSVSHAWTEGHFAHYFLTGDRRSYETGCAVADFFARRDLARPYDFLDCRVPGWFLIMMASAYHATGDPYYLNAARVVVQRVLETQDKTPRPLPEYQAAGRKPFQQGGWSRMMVPGHCECQPRHRGNAGFMVAVLLSGLKYYHDVTGDPRVKQSIIDGAHYLLDETYSDDVQGFRYTSCPNTAYRPGASPLMVEGIARAYLWTRDERFRRVLTEALPRGERGSSYGKGFSMYYRVGPRVLADLEAAGLDLAPVP